MYPDTTVTFVTAFIDLYEDRSKDKSPDKCINLFKQLAASGISICLYVSSLYESIGIELSNTFNNVKLMKITNLEDTETYKIIKNLNPILPEIRTDYHDTLNFMILMNAKSEFVNNASIINPFNTSHFAWIDFSICHVLSNYETVLARLKLISHSNLKPNMLLFPCPWNKETSKNKIMNDNNSIAKHVFWRFCGGFFIGDKKSVQDMHLLVLSHLSIFIEKYKCITWEVNIWAWLEANYNWNISSYIANHNNSILEIPSDYITIVASLTTIPSRLENIKLTIDSLINQVEYIYINLCKEYKRFGIFNLDEYKDTILNYLNCEPYKSKVIITIGEDFGPATKYLGALEYISNSQWIFFCDDDQEYNKDLIHNMKNTILNTNKNPNVNANANEHNLCVYQNRYNIVKTGSGGIIHGYVGNMAHRSYLDNLPNFSLPEIARYVDDQWMSIYYFFNNINILPTNIEKYSDIFGSLDNGNEKIGNNSLASIGNRNEKVKELENYFKIKFIENGMIIKIE